MVEVRVLGPAEALVAGEPVDLGAPKQRALLALLASRLGAAMLVDVVLEELWEGSPPRSAKTSLQAYVANLRRILEPDRPPRAPAAVLRTNGNGYLLDSRVVECDVRLFGEHAAAGWRSLDLGRPEHALREFEASLALWRGPAFVEVAGAPSVVPEVARLEELRLSAEEGRCAALLAVDAPGMAAAEADAFVRTNPLREFGCELLSLALYRTGRQADALAVLRTNQNRLQEELGIDPRPALRDLERRILNQDPALDWRPGPAATAPEDSPTEPRSGAGAGDEVFVGREAELRQLIEAADTAVAGRGNVLTLSGELGAGKTALLRQFAESTDAPVFWYTCPEHVTAPPMWPWKRVLRAVRTDFPQLPVPADVAEFLDANGLPTVDGPADPVTLRLFDAIVGYLTGASHAVPLVVVLDHVHRASPASLRLLAHMAESVPASRLLVVISYRSGEAEAMVETSAALARIGTIRIGLEGLTVGETQRLATAMLGREVAAATAESLSDRTAGNPLFLREMIKLLTTDDRREQPSTAPVPAAVRDVLLARIGQLPETTAHLLSVAAVAGRSFRVDVVAEAASLEPDVAMASLEQAITADLVTEDHERAGWFHFHHALAAEALYEGIAQLDRVRLHRSIGEAAARAWTENTQRAAHLAAHWPLMFCRAARQ